jgi:hypothetical protein
LKNWRLRLTIFTAIFGCFIAIAGCSRYNLTARDVIGTYKIDYTDGFKICGSEILILRSDWTYKQTLKLPGGKVIENTGKWEYQDPRTDQECVYLHWAITSLNFGPKKDRYLIASSFEGNIYLEIHPDDADEYKKVH